MDFQFTVEEKAFRQELLTFLQQELPPEWDGEGEGDGDEEWAFGLQVRKKLAQKGWLTLAWPKEHGGAAASIMTQTVFREEMAYHRAPGIDFWGITMLAPTLMIHGTEEQKRRFLLPVARGEIQWCQGYSEPGSGSDLASLQTRADVDGDDYVVNGTKIWTSNAHHADWIMLLARTNQEAEKHRGITFLLVDMKSPGVSLRPIINMAGIHGFNQLFFDNVRVPKENKVGEENRGWYVGATLLDFERSGVQYSAGGRRFLDELVRFAKDTTRNGQPLAKRPEVRHRLADAAIEVEVSRMNSYNIAWQQSNGKVPNKEASVSKLFSTEMQQRLADTGMHLLGMYGQLAPGSKWAPLKGRIERNFLSSHSATIAGGTSEIQRNVIANRGLGLPRG
ncbi:MAG: acyl-CoA dehydrogenase family protein [Chloroflexi bacterium]|nr:acyl-CoA dehydrogenase family protein [Chloroflexota bacterium]